MNPNQQCCLEGGCGDSFFNSTAIIAPSFTETGKEVAGARLELAFCSLGVGVRTGEGTAEKLLTLSSSQKRRPNRETRDPSEPCLSSRDRGFVHIQASGTSNTQALSTGR